MDPLSKVFADAYLALPPKHLDRATAQVTPARLGIGMDLGQLSLEIRRQRFFLQLTYDTPREKVEELVVQISQLIIEHPLAEESTCEVRFNNFGESSLDILVMFHLQVEDYATELREREAVLLQIMDLVRDAGVEFAFPTRTLQVTNTTEKMTTRHPMGRW